MQTTLSKLTVRILMTIGAFLLFISYFIPVVHVSMPWGYQSVNISFSDLTFGVVYYGQRSPSVIAYIVLLIVPSVILALWLFRGRSNPAGLSSGLLITLLVLYLFFTVIMVWAFTAGSSGSGVIYTITPWLVILIVLNIMMIRLSGLLKKHRLDLDTTAEELRCTIRNRIQPAVSGSHAPKADYAASGAGYAAPAAEYTVPSAEYAMPGTRRAQVSAYKYCMHCGTKLNRNDSFCISCGGKQ